MGWVHNETLIPKNIPQTSQTLSFVHILLKQIFPIYAKYVHGISQAIFKMAIVGFLCVV